MKIVHVVTLVTPDGAYGGPVQVALNQVSALRARGHDAIVAAACHGYSKVPRAIDDVPVRLFPARQAVPGMGFAGLTSPALLAWFAKSAADFDVAHLHLARDLVLLPTARLLMLRRTPYVAQTHGMIRPIHRPMAGVVDRTLTQPALRKARRVFYLTEHERRDLLFTGVEPDSLHRLVNGVPAFETSQSAERDPVLPRVLSVARLHQRKRPVAFIKMATEALNLGSMADFRLIGPDEGEGESVRRCIEKSERRNVRWLGALPHTEVLEQVAGASLFVLPSIDEPFPMAVLEAMACGVPVVVTDTCGLAPVIRRTHCGLVISSDLSDFTERIVELLQRPTLLCAMGERARTVAAHEFGMDAVARTLEDVYAPL